MHGFPGFSYAEIRRMDWPELIAWWGELRAIKEPRQ